jgi:chromosome segregation ATPase
LEQAYADLQKSRSETQAASDAAEQQLAASNSKIEMLSCALKGTEKDKERALDAISNMYQDTDKRLKALSSGAAAMPLSDAGSLSRIATLQVLTRPFMNTLIDPSWRPVRDP